MKKELHEGTEDEQKKANTGGGVYNGGDTWKEVKSIGIVNIWINIKELIFILLSIAIQFMLV